MVKKALKKWWVLGKKQVNDYNVWYGDAAVYDVINDLKKKTLGKGQNAIDFDGSQFILSQK